MFKWFKNFWDSPNIISLASATNSRSVDEIREGHIERMVTEISKRLKETMATGSDYDFFIAEDWVEAYHLSRMDIDRVLLGFAKKGWRTARQGIDLLKFFRPEADIGWHNYDKVFEPGGEINPKYPIKKEN